VQHPAGGGLRKAETLLLPVEGEVEQAVPPALAIHLEAGLQWGGLATQNQLAAGGADGHERESPEAVARGTLIASRLPDDLQARYNGLRLGKGQPGIGQGQQRLAK
jgi:hypothetical protein